MRIFRNKKTPQGVPAAFLGYFTKDGLRVLWFCRDRLWFRLGNHRLHWRHHRGRLNGNRYRQFVHDAFRSR
jgi:hypothetical protein